MAATGVLAVGTRRRGFTLAELASSMAVSTVLLGGIGAAVVLAGRAVPSYSTPSGGVIEAEQAIARIASDLVVAVSASTWKAAEIEFAVADRNSDNNPERFGYKWSGVAGTPLWLAENGAVAAALVPKVYEFQLTYLKSVVDSRMYLTGVRIRLRSSSNLSMAVETTVFLLNAPEVTLKLEEPLDAT